MRLVPPMMATIAGAMNIPISIANLRKSEGGAGGPPLSAVMMILEQRESRSIQALARSTRAVGTDDAESAERVGSEAIHQVRRVPACDEADVASGRYRGNSTAG